MLFFCNYLLLCHFIVYRTAVYECATVLSVNTDLEFKRAKKQVSF